LQCSARFLKLADEALVDPDCDRVHADCGRLR
jgi:hypothetical protein